MKDQRIAVWKDGSDNVTVIAASGDVVESEFSMSPDLTDWPLDLGVYDNKVGEGIMVWEGEAFDADDAPDKEWIGTWRRPTTAELKELVVNGSPW